MHILKRNFSSVSQRAVENIIIFVLAAALYTYGVSFIPPKLHHFEEWIDIQFRFLSGDWSEFWREYSQFGSNDTNAAVRSPFWLFLIFLSSKLLTDPLLAHRVPSVLITALAPVLIAEITRRFYRKDMALFAGLVAVGSQHFMFLGRIGGYVAPTTTLLLGIMLCAMSVAWEDNKKAWIPLTITFLLMPMMYSTIRYMSLMAPLIIGLQFIRSKDFRKRHIVPMIASLVIFFGYASIFARGGPVITAVNFFRARGEQHLLTEEMLRANDSANQETISHRLTSLIKTTGDQNLTRLVEMYKNGERFFDWYYGHIYYSMHKILLALFGLGAVVATFKSFWQPRYAVWLLWSLLGWVPLMVTTGVTNNRMLNGLPADLFLITLGLMVPYDLVARLVGPRLILIPRTIMVCALAYYVHFSFERLIFDCLKQCN